MSFWKKVVKFFMPPTIQEYEETQKAKKLLKEAEVIDAAIEEATVELKPLDKADVITAKPKRARTKKGRFVADDKSTPDINEAWVGGKAPKKKKKKKVSKFKDNTLD